MTRITYVIVSKGGIAGGHKVGVRHVEALRELGFDAYCLIGGVRPAWFDFDVPLISGDPRPDDIVVLADDAPNDLKTMIARRERTIVFSQNPYHFSVSGVPVLDQFPADRFPAFIACCSRLKATIERLYPLASVELVPCFADERRFHPSPEKRPIVAYSPRKRPFEAQSISSFFRKYHPAHADMAWRGLENLSESMMAAGLREAGVYLSLSRLEAGAMTTLEALASGCIVAGFTGVGGVEYATPENGFWVPEDDCEAAADVLALAVDIFKTGGKALDHRLEAARATAEIWSYANFRPALEAAWMRLAPQARLRDGPLD